jgi:transcriptional regulator with XRE-family HTH domain
VIVVSNVGAKIKEIRTKNNDTQENLAKHLGVSQQAIVGWEHGNRDVGASFLGKIADKYGVSVDYFYKSESA